MLQNVYDSLYVGDVQDATRKYDEFDKVISLCFIYDDSEIESDVISLRDDESLDYESFTMAVEETVEAAEDEKKVLVHCNMGASRSPAVLIAAIGELAGISFEQAREKVVAGHTQMHPSLREAAERYLSEAAEAN